MNPKISYGLALFQYYNDPSIIDNIDVLTPQVAYKFAVAYGRNQRCEEILSKDAHWSYRYASDILRGRFELGESAIKESFMYSNLYNVFILGQLDEHGLFSENFNVH